MEIRQAAIKDLPDLAEGALMFYATSKFLKNFRLDRFIAIWTKMLETGTGVIFSLYDGPVGVGAIGGVVYPDLYSGHLVATEFFWFVVPEYRGKNGMELYWKFEHWALAQKCKEIRMVHLMDSMPDRLATVYKRLGYEAAETHYVKSLEV